MQLFIVKKIGVKMKEYIKLFNGINAANGYKINDIPFTSTIKSASGESDINLLCNKPDASIIIENGEPKILTEVTITNTWNPSASDKNTKVTISGNVDLCGKTDCYSIEFEEGGHLTINPDARLRIWEGGIVNEDAESVSYFTFESRLSEIYDTPFTSFGELLFYPTLNRNNHPKAIINYNMHLGKDGNNYRWQKYTVLVYPINSWTKSKNISTYIYKWDYSSNDWYNINLDEIDKFILLYQTTLQYDYITYTFESNLIGNDNFSTNIVRQGYQSLGNSYSAKINIEKFIEYFPNNTDKKVTSLNKNNLDETTGSLLPGETFTIRQTGIQQFTIPYKDLIWDPSFEEDVIPTRGLMKGAAPNAELHDLPIFKDPVVEFDGMAEENIPTR